MFSRTTNVHISCSLPSVSYNKEETQGLNSLINPQFIEGFQEELKEIAKEMNKRIKKFCTPDG